MVIPFFVISGYLAFATVFGVSREWTIGYLIKKCISRIVRFWMMIMAADMMIYLLYLLFGFHTNDLMLFSDSPWISQYYLRDYSAMDVLLDPIKTLIMGGSDLNPPFWCMRNIMWSSIAIYVYCWGINKVKSRVLKIGMVFLACFVIIGLLVINKDSFVACFMGGACAFFFAKMKEKNLSISPIICVVLLFLPTIVGDRCGSYLVTSAAFCGLILAIHFFHPISRALEIHLFQGLGKISWGVYSFHLPVFYSIGAILLVSWSGSVGDVLLPILCCITLFAAIALLSIAFLFTFQRPIHVIQSKILHFGVKD